MVATMTKATKGTGTVAVADKSATAETSLQVPTVMAPNPPEFKPGMDLQQYIKEQQAFLQGLIQQEELQRESVRATIREQISVIQAELDPLIADRDTAKKEYDRLSSLCASKQADINLLLENPVFPQTKKAASRGKGQTHTPEQLDKNGVILHTDPLGNKVYNAKGLLRVDKRSLRHVLNNNPALNSQYDYEEGVILASV